MKERPILFGAPMVRALLDGTKTVTRRLIKPSWSRCLDLDFDDDRERARIGCPYGAPGDRLWVRETFYCDDFTAGDIVAARRGYVGKGPTDAEIIEQWQRALDYRADHDCNTYEAGCPCRDDDGGSSWRPSIHMPRWASRITLEVVSVCVERLHDITEEDAQREGIEAIDGEIPNEVHCARAKRIGEMMESGRVVFSLLWDRINGDRAPWASNPWIWRVEFRRIPKLDPKTTPGEHRAGVVVPVSR